MVVQQQLTAHLTEVVQGIILHMDHKFGSIDREFASLRSEMNRRFDGVDDRFDRVEARLGLLEAKRRRPKNRE
jgi:hypothetical protein